MLFGRSPVYNDAMRRLFVANLSRLIWTVIVLTAVATFVAEFRPWIATWAVSASGDNGGTANYQLIGLMVPAAAVLAAAVWAALGLLIYRRRSGDLFGLAVSLVFVLFGIANTGVLSLGDLADAWSLPARALHGLSNTLLITVGYLIPNGRFVPRWSIWLAAAFAVWTAVGIAMPTIDPMTARGGWQLLFLLFLLTTLVSLGYRYVRRPQPSSNCRSSGSSLEPSLRPWCTRPLRLSNTSGDRSATRAWRRSSSPVVSRSCSSSPRSCSP